MEPTLINPTDKCPNCGGGLNFDHYSIKQTCPFCGSEFTFLSQKKSSPSWQPAGTYFIPFETMCDKEKVLKWLIEDIDAPVEILNDISLKKPQRWFIPTYVYNISYEGTYNEVGAGGDIETEGIPHKGSKKLWLRAGFILDPKERHKAEMPGMPPNDKMRMFDATETAGAELEAEGSAEYIWTSIGKPLLAKMIDADIKQQAKTYSPVTYTHHLTYKVQTDQKLYMPEWWVEARYSTNDFRIIIDGISGAIKGDKPSVAVTPPSRISSLKIALVTGFAAWVCYGVARGILPVIFGNDFQVDSTRFNNVFLSPIGSEFWFWRGFIFVVLYPLLYLVIFHAQRATRFYKNLQNKKERTLYDALSGKSRNPFD